MKRTITASILVFGVALAGALYAQKAVPKGNAQGKPQTVCPVLGNEIDKDVHVDYKGKRIYFCCAACIEDFNKAPEKYMEQMRRAGVVLENSPKSPDAHPHRGHGEHRR